MFLAVRTDITQTTQPGNAPRAMQRVLLALRPLTQTVPAVQVPHSCLEAPVSHPAPMVSLEVNSCIFSVFFYTFFLFNW